MHKWRIRSFEGANPFGGRHESDVSELLRIVTTILQYHFRFQLVPRLTRIFDRTFVLNGRDVAWLAIERDCAQHTAHNLAAACLGQGAHIIDLADDHHGTQFTAYR